MNSNKVKYVNELSNKGWIQKEQDATNWLLKDFQTAYKSTIMVVVDQEGSIYLIPHETKQKHLEKKEFDENQKYYMNMVHHKPSYYFERNRLRFIFTKETLHLADEEERDLAMLVEEIFGSESVQEIKEVINNIKEIREKEIQGFYEEGIKTFGSLYEEELHSKKEIILVRIEVERLNETFVSHQIVNTMEEVEVIKQEHKEMKQSLYSSSGFVGYYDWYVDVIDISTVTMDQLKGITLKDFKRLLDYVS